MDLFIDGMLSDPQARELEQHAGSCAACKQALSDALRLKTALSLLGDRQPPAGLAQSAIKKARRRPVYAYISAATAVAAAAIVLVAVLSTGRIGGDDSATPQEEIIMFSTDMAAEEAAPMAPEAYDGGLLNGMADDSTMMEAEQRSTAGLAKGGELHVFATEAEFASAYGEAYYKPQMLPEGAVLESITPVGNALVFAYRLGENQAYVFEWLTEVRAGGLEAELEATFGGIELFVLDNGYYVLQEAEFLLVYWEQDGQVFRTRLPAGMDFRPYSIAQKINP